MVSSGYGDDHGHTERSSFSLYMMLSARTPNDPANFGQNSTAADRRAIETPCHVPDFSSGNNWSFPGQVWRVYLAGAVWFESNRSTNHL
jgi:hypothetical protein